MNVTAAPHRNSSPTLLAIESTWERLASRVSPELYPFLDGVPLIELREGFIRRTTPDAWKSRVLYALLEASVAGDELATHTIVRLFIPKAALMSRSCAALRGMSADDAIAVTISAFWEAARIYPLNRTNNPSANLYFNALNLITGGHSPAATEISVEDDYLEWKGNQNDAGNSPDQDLAEVLAWALESKILDRDEIKLMVRYYLADNTTREREDLANDLGVTPLALQKRASRIRLRLIEAVRDHIRIQGRW